MPLSKPRLNSHSQHLSFSQLSNQTEQKRNVDGLFLSTRNRSPSCGSFSSQISMESNPGKTMKVAKASETTIKQGFCKIIFRTLLLVLLYYLSSIGLTFYQKWLMRVISHRPFLWNIEIFINTFSFLETSLPIINCDNSSSCKVHACCCLSDCVGILD